MGGPPQDERSALAQGYMWASRVTSISLQAVIPAGIGYWLDGRWGTSPWLLIVGTVIGFASMMRELIKFSQKCTSNDRKSPPSDSPKT